MPLEIIYGNEIAFFLIGLLSDVGFLFAALMAFCELVDHEYLEHPKQWLMDGKPSGGPITRDAVGFWNLSSQGASGSLLWEWYWRTPSWTVGDIKAINCLTRLRRWLTVSIIISVLISIAGFLLSRWLLFTGAG